MKTFIYNTVTRSFSSDKKCFSDVHDLYIDNANLDTSDLVRKVIEGLRQLTRQDIWSEFEELKNKSKKKMFKDSIDESNNTKKLLKKLARSNCKKYKIEPKELYKHSIGWTPSRDHLKLDKYMNIDTKDVY